MAFQTPFHLQRRLLPGQRHLVHPAMTGFAAYALIHVNAVIEINEIRQIMHPRPRDRGIVAKARSNRLERRAGVPDLRMTVHASFGRRNIGEPRSLHRRMAVTTVQPHVTHMVGVAEWHRLLSCDTGLRGPRRSAPCAEKP